MLDPLPCSTSAPSLVWFRSSYVLILSLRLRAVVVLHLSLLSSATKSILRIIWVETAYTKWGLPVRSGVKQVPNFTRFCIFFYLAQSNLAPSFGRRSEKLSQAELIGALLEKPKKFSLVLVCSVSVHLHAMPPVGTTKYLSRFYQIWGQAGKHQLIGNSSKLYIA